MRMGLQHGGASAHDFPSLASRVERRHTADANASGEQGNPGSVAWRVGGRPELRAIDIEDEEVGSLAGPTAQQAVPLALCPEDEPADPPERACAGLRLAPGSEPPKSARASSVLASAPVRRAPVISSGERMQALVEGFQRLFAADGVAEEHRHKVDHFIAPEAAAGKAHRAF
jgi:hypothetical protein